MTQHQLQVAIVLKRQSLAKAKVRVEMLQIGLDGLLKMYKPPSKRAISDEAILETCCSVFRVSVDDVMSKSRIDRFVQARQACMFIIRSYADRTYKEIGMFFCRDHSTVLHNITLFPHRIKQDRNIRERYEECLALLKNNN